MTDEMKPEVKEEKECKPCIESAIMLAVGTAHSACPMIEDEKKRNECDAWVKALKPGEMKSENEIWVGILERVGIEGANKKAQMFNQGYKNGVITLVSKWRLEQKPIPKEFEDAYNDIMKTWRP